MKMFFALVWLCACGCACATAPTARGLEIPRDVQNQVDALNAGGQVERAQTLQAVARKTVVLATALADATRRVDNANATAEQKNVVAKTEVARAVSVAKTETAGARETADANAAQARGTADAKLAASKTEAARANETAVVVAQVAKTESAQRAMTAQAHTDATATYVAQAPTRIAIANIQAHEQTMRAAAQAQAEAGAATSIQLAPYRAAWDMFWLPVFVSFLALLFLAGLFVLFRAFAQYIDSRTLDRASSALQKRVIVDKDGIPRGFIGDAADGTVILEPLLLPAGTSEPTDDFPDEPMPAAPNADADAAESENLFRYHNPNGDDYLTKSTPEQNAARLKKQQAARLLRAAMEYASSRHGTARVERIETAERLEMSAETWQAAVTALKPYVLTRTGRNGGTFCGPEYPHLVALYDAVVQDKIFKVHAPRPDSAPAALSLQPT